MKRRRQISRELSADQLLAALDVIRKETAQLPPRAQVAAERRALLQLGYTPLDVFRARLWLKRGSPSTWQWDDPH